MLKTTVSISGVHVRASGKTRESSMRMTSRGGTP